MRYKLIPPVEGGFAWWSVIDTQSHEYWGEDNFAVATISIRAPSAEQLGLTLLEHMNAQANLS